MLINTPAGVTGEDFVAVPVEGVAEKTGARGG